MAISNYLETTLLNVSLRGIAFTAPTTVYLALFKTDPTDAATGTECSGNAYARQAITFSAPVDGVIKNSAIITFPLSTGAWGAVTHIGIFDSLTAGNLLYHGMLSVSQTISTNNQLVLNANQLTITLD